MNTDRIEKQILLRASRERVWRAIVDSHHFGRWFGIAFDGPFVEGQSITGKIVPTTMDAEVARMQKTFENVRVQFAIEKIEPMRRFSFRWHPYAVDLNVDYSKEPMTLIVFELEDAPGGILLKISESGFDKIPLERRAQAFKSNEGGWEIQTTLIQRYLATNSDGAA